jgi:hypothetical protein
VYFVPGYSATHVKKKFFSVKFLKNIWMQATGKDSLYKDKGCNFTLKKSSFLSFVQTSGGGVVARSLDVLGILNKKLGKFATVALGLFYYFFNTKDY